MNKKRMLEVADLIEKSAGYFDMATGGHLCFDKEGHVCGTAGCIAGFSHLIAKECTDDPDLDGRTLLDLNERQERVLFTPYYDDFNGYDRSFYFRDRRDADEGYISHKHAAAMLRLCVKRNRVTPQEWYDSAPPRQESLASS